MNPTIQQGKSVMRKEIKKMLLGLSLQVKQDQSEKLYQKVLNSDVYRNSKRISIFLPMSDEINTLPILQSMFSDDKECFIPHYSKDEMIMVRLSSWDEYEMLPTTPWGIKQPAQFDANKDALFLGGLDLIFMPGLAFTLSGARLGRGKGYYDKYLKKCMTYGKMPHTMALIFNEQLVDDIPVNENDVFVNSVLFPSLTNDNDK